MVRRSLFYFLVAFSFSSCATSTKALEKGQYNKAIRIAKSDLKKGKNVTENISILNAASNQVVDQAIAENQPKLESPEVNDWIKVQTNFYTILENIGEANQLSKGNVSEPYDKLCEQKSVLDYRIADHFYQEGEMFLDTYHTKKQKLDAREGYDKYKKSLDYSGDKYFPDINDKIADCITYGRVYHKSYDYNPGHTIFFKPLPKDAHYEADCIINSSRSGCSVSETRTTNQKTYNEQIEVRKDQVIDTAGVVTYIPIYETIYAYESINKITVTLSTTTWVNVTNNTGQCHLNTWSFSKSISDTYEEINYTGDLRAYPPGAVNKTGAPNFFRSNLEDRLDKEVKRELGI